MLAIIKKIKSQLKQSTGKIFNSTWFMTLFATTLGVLLAFYLSNLNTKHTTEIREIKAVKNLDLELLNNEKELKDSEENDSLLSFLEEMINVDNSLPTILKVNGKFINKITEKYPKFIKIIDSTQTNNNEYHYYVDYELDLEIDELQDIAWETSKMSNITNEFSYDCLSHLVKYYNLQKVYISEQQKLISYLTNSNFEKLHKGLLISQQIRSQLLELIIETRLGIKKCG